MSCEIICYELQMTRALSVRNVLDEHKGNHSFMFRYCMLLKIKNAVHYLESQKKKKKKKKKKKMIWYGILI